MLVADPHEHVDANGPDWAECWRRIPSPGVFANGVPLPSGFGLVCDR